MVNSAPEPILSDIAGVFSVSWLNCDSDRRGVIERVGEEKED